MRRRTDAVAVAREAGDRVGAQRLGKLRKPTVAAWVINRLAHTEPEALAGYFALGDRLRTASGSELRALSDRRHRVVTELVELAAAAADGAGHPANDQTLRDVETVLRSALGNSGLADLVRTGRLITTTVAPEADWSALAAPGELPPARPQPQAPSRSAVREAQSAVRDAEALRDNAKVEAQRAEAAYTEADERLTKLRETLRSAEDRWADLRVQARAARHTADAADTALRRARRALATAETANSDPSPS